MLEVDVQVRDSEIAGKGLFANQVIEQGTIWYYTSEETILRVNESQWNVLVASESLPTLKSDIARYSLYNKQENQMWVLLDNGRYCNHSSNPNSECFLHQIGSHQGFASRTLRKILPGEEIVEDYKTYESCPWKESDDSLYIPTAYKN